MQIKIKDKNFCPRFSYLIIRNVEIKPSEISLAKRLEQCGVRSINNLVDATNYVMLDIGQPLHAYDLDRLEKLEVEKGKFFGIKGPKAISISLNTKNILLEAANFNPPDIRKTSREQGIKTEASYRFARGVDINLTIRALEKAGGMIPGEKEKIIDLYPEEFKPLILNYQPETERAKKILASLGFKINGDKIEIPSWRYDIKIKEDLAEEIYRIDGYDKIKSEMPDLALQVPEFNPWPRKAKEILIACGYSEVYNYAFASRGELKLKNKDAYLRSDLITGLKEIYKNNLNNFKVVKIFELAKVYNQQGEANHLAIAGQDVKETVYFLLKALNAEKFKLEIQGDFCEFNFSSLEKLANQDKNYRPISKYPGIKRDISFWIKKNQEANEIIELIKSTDNLIDKVELLDEYAPDGKRSLAFRIVYQHPARTLTDQEVNIIHRSLEEKLKEKYDAAIR